MMIIRSVRSEDIDALENLANSAKVGLTTLPPDRKLLEKKIVASQDAFAAERNEPGNDHYLFVLEDTETGMAVGTAGIVAAVGVSEAFYSYRVGTVVHASRELGVYNKISTLYLSNDYTGSTELRSLFLDHSYRKDKNGKLLSKSRFLFMAEFPHRFAHKVIAEMRGFTDENGRSPFWEGLGRRFFSMNFSQADFLTGIGDEHFIAELMPKYPVYVNLLSDETQAVIGQVHENTKPALSILEKEGFSYQGYVDIFDAGPTVEAPLKRIRAVRDSITLPLTIGTMATEGEYHLISNRKPEAFRCALVQLPLTKGHEIAIDEMLAEALNVGSGDTVRVVPLG
ncbi:MAG: arginine N-succinyltransferase [Deltaproteobacteria bacterium]|nr:arginine N-succinyltransferase [Deltaproteobacteria bacterium]